jgi:hypothetical protein
MALAIITTIGAKAQYREGTWSLQPKLGMVLSTLTNMPKLSATSDVDLDKTFFFGYQMGAEVEYQMTDKFSLAAGLNYSSQGSNWKDYKSPAISVDDCKIDLGYVNMPFLANYYLLDGLAIKTGVQLGMLVSAKFKGIIELADPAGRIPLPLDDNYKDDCNKLDVSIPIGLSYEMDNHVVVEARYNLGLTHTNKTDLLGEKGMNNCVLVVSFGYKMEL